MCPDWDPTQVRSPGQPITPTPKQEMDDEPFGQALPTAVTVPTSSTSKTDGFIDDLITVFRDTPQNRERAPHTVPLAMHITSRPHAGNKEPVKRRNILSDAKLLAEGAPAETQIILGWTINTRRLVILLPKDKFDAWTAELNKIMKARRTTFGDLKTTVGRLNHVAYVIPLARHFLNWLRAKIRITSQTSEYPSSDQRSPRLDPMDALPHRSPQRDLTKSDHNSSTLPTHHLGRLPFWSWRMQPKRASLAIRNPTTQPPLR
jgi:hypothetical protein